MSSQWGILPEFAFLGRREACASCSSASMTALGPSAPIPTSPPPIAQPTRTRHAALGATVEGTHERWTVLTAPGGQVYCLTDRDPLSGTVRRPVRQ